MKLTQILNGIEICENKLQGIELEIIDLAYDSRSVKPGYLFFAIPGFAQDGGKYIPAAIAAGAAVCVVERLEGIPPQFLEKCILVKNSRIALAQASANFFQHPSEELLMVGVTGTKGKTSTSFLLESIFQASGKKTALLGTVECHYPGKKIKSERTTMESYELQKFLREAVVHGAELAVLEISAHALSLARVHSCGFDGVLFTNLSTDHLDFYGDMETYFKAKCLLFTDLYKKKSGKFPVAVTNLDNSFGARLYAEQKAAHRKIYSFATANADYTAREIQISANGILAQFEGPSNLKVAIDSKLTGHFNLENIMGAMALAHSMGVDAQSLAKGVKNMEQVPGRLERIETTLPFQVFVDYAHMGEALENVLNYLRPLCRGRLMVLFGAGGERDPMRRILLGRVAARLADYTMISSDNPRREDPAKIIAAVEASYLEELEKNPKLKGQRNYDKEIDRGIAIRKVLRMARAGDLICLAGKGHETGQMIGDKEFPFDDREEARTVLREIEVDSHREN